MFGKREKKIISEPLFIHKFKDGDTAAVYKDGHSVHHCLRLNKVITRHHKNVKAAKEWVEAQDLSQKVSRYMADEGMKKVFTKITDDDLYNPYKAQTWKDLTDKMLAVINDAFAFCEFFKSGDMECDKEDIATIKVLAEKYYVDGNIKNALFLYMILAKKNVPNAVLWLKSFSECGLNNIEDRTF